MLHHFFETHGLGEKVVHLHADNCSGQNKNRYMMYYLMWRVLTRQHDQITISFLPVGHTKFFPDAGFGMLKKKFRMTKVDCLSDIATVVSQSATMNHPQLVGDQSGNVIVPTYDWITFFEDRTVKTALKGIKSYSHFRFSSKELGTVNVCKSSVVNDRHSPERKIMLLKDVSWRPKESGLPSVVIPEGLSLTRQWYLYNKIREFCSLEVKDLVCPMPRKRLLSSDEEEEN